MKRILYQELLKWKGSRRRKPLLLQGARQVGKTWLINEFGKRDNFVNIPLYALFILPNLIHHLIHEEKEA